MHIIFGMTSLTIQLLDQDASYVAIRYIREISIYTYIYIRSIV